MFESLSLVKCTTGDALFTSARLAFACVWHLEWPQVITSHLIAP